jgi:hypothetical protein
MAGPKRNPLDFGFGERSFVQRFILAEILGPPRAQSRAPAAANPAGPPLGEGPADDAAAPAGSAARREQS